MNLLTLWHDGRIITIRFWNYLANAAESGRIWPDLAIDRVGFGIWPFWLDPVKLSRRNSATATGRCRILAAFAKLWFLHFVIILCEPNTEKYFWDQNYFTTEIILRRNKRSIKVRKFSQTTLKCVMNVCMSSFWLHVWLNHGRPIEAIACLKRDK
jgi:hypothetical protein